MGVDRRAGRVRRFLARTLLPVVLVGGMAASSVPAHGDTGEWTPPAVSGEDEVPLSAVPLVVRYTVLAAQDPDFYAEPGGWLRSVLGGRPDPAGLSSAYARRLAPTRDPEAVARRLEDALGKDLILQRYLNTGYYGRGAVGIGAAAEAYFGVTPDRLTAAQGAVLAAALSGCDPAVNEDDARAHWSAIVGVAAEREWLSAGLTYPMVDPPAGNPPRGQREPSTSTRRITPGPRMTTKITGNRQNSTGKSSLIGTF